MKVEIKLKNPKYCNGCPFENGEERVHGVYFGRACELGYWTVSNGEYRKYKKGIFTWRDYKGRFRNIYDDPYCGDSKLFINRPQECIINQGE